MLCNRLFWPRRKKCAEWVDYAQYMLQEAIINDIIIGQFYNQGMLDNETAEKLEVTIKSAIEDVCEKQKKLMCKPL